MAPAPSGQQKLRGYPQVTVRPEFGLNYRIDDNSALSAAFYVGGSSTEYKNTNIVMAGLDPSQYSHRSGMQLSQYFGALSYSRFITPCHSLGASLVLVEQTLSISGLHGFDTAARSTAPGLVCNRNIDYSLGVGARVGWVGQLYPGIIGGASYTTRMACQKFKKYQGFLVQGGQLDVPAILAAGITWDWTCNSKIAFEWQRLFYNDCKQWSNSFDRYIQTVNGTQLLGASDGPGFGWNNLDVYKVGADYCWSECLTLRGGYCLSRIPYNNTQLDVNILTENIGRHHMTLGFTYALNPCEEIDFSYFHLFQTRITGPSQLTTSIGTITQRMYQDSFEISYGRKF
jgi:long-chain fatty acid transport protein